MADEECTVVVSFAETPLAEVSAKAAELASRGWIFDEERERKGDPWARADREAVP